ncbi:hypothetical protein L1987_32141 [Smallanthus sonchifolius]|uniref:Uncharacterized protein n=1 Tax=Smallanthus sonchifolius TaxID=185202 RepID=A0ACB9I9E0_9ASTR|nr:hypothetical protein L1987_32141 [Smallanthus sonchifolius]
MRMQLRDHSCNFLLFNEFDSIIYSIPSTSPKSISSIFIHLSSNNLLLVIALDEVKHLKLWRKGRVRSLRMLRN